MLEEIEEGSLIQTQQLDEILFEFAEDGLENFSILGSLSDYEIEEYAKICRFKQDGGILEYNVEMGWPDDLDYEKRENEKSKLKDSFLRAGVIEYTNISEVVERLSSIDDIILALDTNVVLNCTISASLLEKIYSRDFPNWILIAIPKISMAEIEDLSAKKIEEIDHPRNGWPSCEGRIGQRGLQELMDLDEPRPDRPGLTVITIGELSGTTESFTKSKDWWRDSKIRSQFRDFLRNIDFHKGIYFLSQNRVNTMMSSIEGVEGLYLQKPDWNETSNGRLSFEKFSKLAYELAVQFGEIKIRGEKEYNLELKLSIFWPEKQVEHWENSTMKVSQLST